MLALVADGDNGLFNAAGVVNVSVQKACPKWDPKDPGIQPPPPPPLPDAVTIAIQATGGTNRFAFTGRGPNAFATTFVLLATASGRPAFTPASTMKGLAAGEYKFAQSLPVGWVLSSVVCAGTGLASSEVTREGAAIIKVDAGAKGICTFANDLPPSAMTIAKVTTGGGGQFTFTASGPADGVKKLTTPPFTLKTDSLDTPVSSPDSILKDLTAGLYDITETRPALPAD